MLSKVSVAMKRMGRGSENSSCGLKHNIRRCSFSITQGIYVVKVGVPVAFPFVIHIFLFPRVTLLEYL